MREAWKKPPLSGRRRIFACVTQWQPNSASAGENVILGQTASNEVLEFLGHGF